MLHPSICPKIERHSLLHSRLTGSSFFSLASALFLSCFSDVLVEGRFLEQATVRCHRDIPFMFAFSRPYSCLIITSIFSSSIGMDDVRRLFFAQPWWYFPLEKHVKPSVYFLYKTIWLTDCQEVFQVLSNSNYSARFLDFRRFVIRNFWKNQCDPNIWYWY